MGYRERRSGELLYTVIPAKTDPNSRKEVDIFAGFGIEDAWEGQVLVYRYGYRARKSPLQTSWKLPSMEGLVAPRDGNRPRKEYRIDGPEGALWVDESWIPYVVTGTGARKLPGAVATLRIERDRAKGSRFRLGSARTVVEVSDALDLTVRPLPNKPVDYSGLIGEFAFDSKVGSARARAGESVPWVITVTGDGTLEGFDLKGDTDIDGARIYDNSPTTTAEIVEGAYRAKGTFERVIVPTKVGTLQVPPLEVITFSPLRGEFVTHTITPDPIKVSPGKEGVGALESYEQQEDFGEIPYDGVQEIYRSGRDHAPSMRALLPILIGGAALPGVLLGLVEGWGVLGLWLARRREERATEVFIDPRQRLAHLPEDPAAQLAVLDGSLREALALTLGVPTVELNREEAIAGLPPVLAKRARDLTQQLDRIRFAEDSSNRPEKLIEPIRKLVADLAAHRPEEAA